MRTIQEIAAELDHLVTLRNPLVVELARTIAATDLPDGCKEYGDWIRENTDVLALTCLLMTLTMDGKETLRFILKSVSGHHLTHIAIQRAQKHPEEYTLEKIAEALRSAGDDITKEPQWAARFALEPLLDAGYLCLMDIEKDTLVPQLHDEAIANLQLVWEIHGIAPTIEEVQAANRAGRSHDLEEMKTAIQAAFNGPNQDTPLQ